MTEKKTKKTPLTVGQRKWLLALAEPVSEDSVNAQAKRALNNLVEYGYAKFLKRKKQWEATKSGQLRASALSS